MSKAFLSALGLAVATSVAVAAQGVTSKDLLDGLTNPSRWLIYSGDYTGQRFSPLTQITPSNAGQLAAQWTFQTGVVNKFEATPIVLDGVLYVTGPLNHAWAIDARTGKQIWHYQRQLPQGLKVCCGMVNRGFAVYGDRLFMGTLDAHFVALEMKTGKVIYDVEMAPAKDGFAATGAPLVVKDKVIAGVAGGEFANRGFLDAYNPTTGERVWRFHTIPAPGEKGSESWQGDIWARGGGPTWLTGTYDPQLNLLYWGVGNPNPDWDGESRPGDNLYTGSLIALDPDTGTLKWHFQYTPHDTHDWDANEVPVLADLTDAQGRDDGEPQRVLLHQRPHHRRVHPRAAVRADDLVERDRQGWSTGLEPRPGAERERHGDVSGTVRRHELHVAVVRCAAGPVLRHRARDLHALRPPSARGKPHARHADAGRQRRAGVRPDQVVGRAACARRGDR